MNETVRMVHGRKTKSMKDFFREQHWLTLEGWINYIDILLGKIIGDFSKLQEHRT